MNVGARAGLVAAATALAIGVGVSPANAREAGLNDQAEASGSTLIGESQAAPSGDFISDPAPIPIAAPVDQRVWVHPGYSVSGTEGLPEGLTLHPDGRLTGTAPTGRTGVDHVVTVHLAAGKSIRITQVILLRFTGGDTVQQKSKTWEVQYLTFPNEAMRVGSLRCPADHPWTIAKKFDGWGRPGGLPGGVEMWTDGAGVGAAAQGMYDSEGVSVGVMNIAVHNIALWGYAKFDFTLHCTNDAALAGRQ